MNISVYITSYNQKDFLKEAIESVLNQTLRPYEIIIVDDCSSDGSPELIRSYKSKYPDLIIPVFHERNMGVTQVRITALQQVKGDFVTYVDGDDMYLPKKLEVEAGLINKGNFQLAFSNNMYFKGIENNIEHIWAYNKYEMPKTGIMYFETLSRSFPRKSLFRMELVNYNAWNQVGFHDTNLKIYEDYDMRIRLTKNLRVNYTIEPLTKIRIGESGLSHSPKDIHIKSLEYILKKHQSDIEMLPGEQRAKVKNIFDLMINNQKGLVEKKNVIEAGVIQRLFNKIRNLLK